MTFSAPIETIFHLRKSRAIGDIRAALSCYGVGTIVVLEPGRFAHGQDTIGAFTESTLARPMAFGKREIVEAEGIALHVSQWKLRPAGGAEISGRTADVLRRRADGNCRRSGSDPFWSYFRVGAIRPEPRNWAFHIYLYVPSKLPNGHEILPNCSHAPNQSLLKTLLKPVGSSNTRPSAVSAKMSRVEIETLQSKSDRA